MRNGPNVKYVPNRTYADAKLIIAWWVAALARRLPSGMAVYAVSPGAATDTKVVRNAGPALKYLLIPIVNLIPGMNQTPETAARRYLQASEFGTDVSGQFFASAQGKFTGPIEAQRHPHLHDRASQEAAWQAVVKVSGVDFSSPAHLNGVVLKDRRSGPFQSPRISSATRGNSSSWTSKRNCRRGVPEGNAAAWMQALTQRPRLARERHRLDLFYEDGLKSFETSMQLRGIVAMKQHLEGKPVRPYDVILELMQRDQG